MTRLVIVGLVSLVFLARCGRSGSTSPPPPPAASKLAFGWNQPSITAAGHAITPAVSVWVLNAQGYTVTSGSVSITVAIGTNPAGGTLSGTTTVAAVGGVAIFSNLSIDTPGLGYTLTAYADGLNSATSTAFTVASNSTAPVATVTVTPAYTDVEAGTQVTLTATTFDAAGNMLARTVTWASSDPRVMALLYSSDSYSSGTLCGLTDGSATITATSEGKSGTAVVTVGGHSSIECCEFGC